MGTKDVNPGSYVYIIDTKVQKEGMIIYWAMKIKLKYVYEKS